MLPCGAGDGLRAPGEGLNTTTRPSSQRSMPSVTAASEIIDSTRWTWRTGPHQRRCGDVAESAGWRCGVSTRLRGTPIRVVIFTGGEPLDFTAVEAGLVDARRWATQGEDDLLAVRREADVERGLCRGPVRHLQGDLGQPVPIGADAVERAVRAEDDGAAVRGPAREVVCESPRGDPVGLATACRRDEQGVVCAGRVHAIEQKLAAVGRVRQRRVDPPGVPGDTSQPFAVGCADAVHAIPRRVALARTLTGKRSPGGRPDGASGEEVRVWHGESVDVAGGAVEQRYGGGAVGRVQAGGERQLAAVG